ncbi:RidA family protein [Patiriisocius hiemis]|uniref:RidA family protein n=1 Tax=Patiriisocius hiemis TaxID=3075604 RepID=A0ABU2YFU7_9FLAO|nr:RidA family protein [Constantimarinum sp. W242]MDT0556105.1 RidA family protein [Constantimarinum sp. W242]
MKCKLSTLITCITILLITISCNNLHTEETEAVPPIFHKSHEEKKKNAPFSDVVQVGNLYFLAGQIGMNHATRTLVEGGIEAETRQTLENIKDVLAQHDLKMKDVVKATVILDTIGDFAAFNKVYTTYFPQKPARTTFAAEALARGAKIEIEVIAVKSL